METNKHENKRRIKELERAAQAQSGTDKEVTQAVYFSYPQAHETGFNVRMFGDIDGDYEPE